jgi:carbon-monoxide dehydrogenase small subunit
MSDRVWITLELNGQKRSAEIDVRETLVEAIRHNFGLHGTHVGCMTGDCGACTVELDGRITKSCLVLAVAADGSAVTTIEGFGGGGGELHPIQSAFWDGYGFQCGFCLPGMLFAARELLEREPNPSDAEIRHALNGNLCRCTGYDKLVLAVADAARRMRHGVKEGRQL